MQPVPATPPGPLLVLTGALLVLALFGAILWLFAAVAAGRPLLPRRPIEPVPWGGPTALTMILLWLAFQVVAIVAYLGATGQKQPSFAGSMTALALANAATLVVVPLALRRTSGARPGHFVPGRGVEPGADLARGCIAGLVLTPLVYAVGFVATQYWPPKSHIMEKMIRADPSGRNALLAVISGVLLAPAAEELLFRGILQGWLVRLWTRRDPSPPGPDPGTTADAPDPPAPDPIAVPARPDPDRSPWSASATPLTPPWPGDEGPGRPTAGPWPSLLTSAVFAAIHGSEWPAPIPIFVLSLGLGYLYERTGGLLAPFGLHATFNGISTLMLFVTLLSGGGPGADPSP
jgi:membrane protease YdiL (CAAX protease family)